MIWKFITKKLKRIFKRECSRISEKSFSRILIKYFVMLFICLVLPMAIFNLWHIYSSQMSSRNELIRVNEVELKQAYKSINSVLQGAKENVYDLSVHDTVQYLATLGSSVPDREEKSKELIDLLTATKILNSYIENIGVYLCNTKEIYSCDGVERLSMYEDREVILSYLDKYSDKVELNARKQDGVYPFLLTVIYPINSRNNGNDGLVMIDINVEALSKYLGRGRYRIFGEESALVVLDTAGRVIYSDAYQLYNESMAEALTEVAKSFVEDSGFCTLWEEPYLWSRYYAQKEKFHYVNLVSLRNFEARINKSIILMRNVMMISVLLCLFLAYLLAIWVYRPIKKTILLLDELSMLTGYESDKHKDEIAIIQKSILTFKEENTNLNDQVQERIIALQRAQMYALQAQINPHFLYNTLETIGNLAALLFEENNKVTDMLYSLGKLLRISLEGESFLVLLKEEVEHVKLYAQLLDYRCQNRIHFYVDFPQEMLEEKTLKLTLQPLVENALEHGFKDKRMHGDIWIKGHAEGNRRYIYVTDNGKGIGQDDLKTLQEQLDCCTMKGDKHLGLRNVNQRLKMIYGEECGLLLTAPPSGGFCVTVIYTVL